MSIPSPKIGDVSLYFHIPFCTKKCPYCHFFVLPNETSYHIKLFEGLKLEWERKAHLLSQKKITSIYFGGGTPALFPPKYFATLLDWLAPPTDCEITIEANPESITEEALHAFKKLGINRLSIGAQSFDDDLLKHLGREHTSKKTIEIIDLSASLEFDNISIDLMYDLPHQNVDQWKKTIQQAVALPLTHLSIYNLTIEPETVFFKKQSQIKSKLPSQEDSLAMYEMLLEYVPNYNFLPYEISAFAKPGFYSKHNTGYWLARPFLGFGPSAYSYLDNIRFRNVCHLEKYLTALKNGEDSVDLKDILDFEDRKNELLAVEMRLRQGVNLKTFETRHGPLSKITLQTIEKLKENEWIIEENQVVALSREGVLFYDSVAEALI